MVATTSESLEFPANGGATTGHLARPAEPGTYPAVIVIQEWWGLNDNIRDIANRIAAEGYVALAPDLYHGNLTAEPDEAQKLMMALQQDKAVVDMNGAVAALQARDDVDGSKIGVTGFCLGGGLALLLAMKNPAVTAAAPFYGVPMGDLAEASNIPGRRAGPLRRAGRIRHIGLCRRSARRAAQRRRVARDPHLPRRRARVLQRHLGGLQGR